ncbi:HlyD family secretion protein [Tropicimonas isoalkanivorans]|uniref:Membrane fusion protein, multidrug efflux system n=1 Tax=Tropicimonas isoalkanivorans TaxID=441112 RepID=A0A1I1HR63_9RHOB|nr:HlyD family secretion protein [Tropicimonas isoalkanivorans]SFC23500.1 membrane fusion protein, multidrug efflux system [Tropicimonas isoalkanivorans]
MAFDASQDETQSSKTEAPAKGARRPWKKYFIILVLLGAGLFYGGQRLHGYWTTGRFMVTTDDAYLTADITKISPEVTGHVVAVAFRENQAVASGDILFRIDDGDYKNALERAQNQIAAHDETLKRISAQIEAARTAVTQAEANRQAAEATLKNARSTAERIRSLNSSSFASTAQLDDAEAALDEAEAQLASARATVAAANANVAVLKAQYAEAEAANRGLELAVEQAERDLDRTILRAPYDGVVTNLAVEQGDLVSPGKILAAVVPTDTLYVEANFKETQLAEVTPGAIAHLTFDVLPDLEVEGRVESLAPATGAVFSLLPPENATGNFTKVVQRVPVRIELPAAALADGRLRAGLSTTVSVDTRTADSPRAVAGSSAPGSATGS